MNGKYDQFTWYPQEYAKNCLISIDKCSCHFVYFHALYWFALLFFLRFLFCVNYLAAWLNLYAIVTFMWNWGFLCKEPVTRVVVLDLLPHWEPCITLWVSCDWLENPLLPV